MAARKRARYSRQGLSVGSLMASHKGAGVDAPLRRPLLPVVEVVRSRQRSSRHLLDGTVVVA